MRYLSGRRRCDAEAVAIIPSGPAHEMAATISGWCPPTWPIRVGPPPPDPTAFHESPALLGAATLHPGRGEPAASRFDDLHSFFKLVGLFQICAVLCCLFIEQMASKCPARLYPQPSLPSGKSGVITPPTGPGCSSSRSDSATEPFCSRSRMPQSESSNCRQRPLLALRPNGSSTRRCGTARWPPHRLLCGWPS